MRVEFCRAIAEVLEKDARSVFVSGDLGYNAFEGIAKSSARRFLNAGVAEQNMVGLAAGLAMRGHLPWIYSIIPFVVYRAFEQIRNDLCHHALPVRVVGNGGGFTYGIMGSTHHALEDLGVLKGLPNVKLFFPCSGEQVKASVELIAREPGPTYLRLAFPAYSSPARPLKENPLTLTRHYQVGRDITVIGVGHAVQAALSGLIGVDGAPSADLFGIARFPFDWESDRDLLESVERTRKLLVIDEHYAAGSIGESLRAKLPPLASFELMAAQHSSRHKYGSAKFHLEQCGLTPADVLRRARKMVEN